MCDELKDSYHYGCNAPVTDLTVRNPREDQAYRDFIAVSDILDVLLPFPTISKNSRPLLALGAHYGWSRYGGHNIRKLRISATRDIYYVYKHSFDCIIILSSLA